MRIGIFHPAYAASVLRSWWMAGAACAGLVVLWDVLFWGHAVGCSAAVFAGALGAAVVLQAPRLWGTGKGWLMMMVALGSAAALVEEPSSLALVMAVVCGGMLVLVGQRDWEFGAKVGAWTRSWLYLVGTVPIRTVLDSTAAGRWLMKHPQAAGRWLKGVRLVGWWVVPMAAGMVFVGLFTLANPIIERWWREAFEKLWEALDWLAFLSAGRVALWVVVAVGVYGVLRYRRRRARRAVVTVPPVVRDAGAGPAWLAGVIVRCLIVFNAVFAVQSGLDVTYLFGGAKLPAGMTYAAYAHRGAYPLMATALLAGAFVLGTFRSGGAAQRSIWARRLVYAWIGQNLFLMASTIWRVWLYVDVYSLTRWRVATVIWIVLVGLGFLWIVGRIVGSRTNAWLWRMNVATLFAVMYGCAFVNFDGLIADFNVRHCREVTGEGVAVDVGYLRSLGPEALPALEWLGEQEGGPRAEVEATRSALAGELAGDLKEWRGWTWRRWRAAGGRNVATHENDENDRGSMANHQAKENDERLQFSDGGARTLGGVGRNSSRRGEWSARR
jgi:hypothetical protein